MHLNHVKVYQIKLFKINTVEFPFFIFTFFSANTMHIKYDLYNREYEHCITISVAENS